MNAAQVRAYAQAKWPEAMQSPVAVAIRAVVDAESSANASDLARLATKEEAFKHAMGCIDACEAMGIDYDEETIAGNVESNFPELSADECDDIAAAALAA